MALRRESPLYRKGGFGFSRCAVASLRGDFLRREGGSLRSSKPTDQQRSPSAWAYVGTGHSFMVCRIFRYTSENRIKPTIFFPSLTNRESCLRRMKR
jgi:hypothetical protein